MFEDAHFNSKPRLWRAIFQDGSEIRLVKHPHERTDDLELRALAKRYGKGYEATVSRIVSATGLHPILRYAPVGSD